MCPEQSGAFYSLLFWDGSADQAGHFKPICSPNSELSEAGRAGCGPIRGQPERVGFTFADPVDCLPCGLKTNLP